MILNSWARTSGGRKRSSVPTARARYSSSGGSSQTLPTRTRLSARPSAPTSSTNCTSLYADKAPMLFLIPEPTPKAFTHCFTASPQIASVMDAHSPNHPGNPPTSQRRRHRPRPESLPRRPCKSFCAAAVCHKTTDPGFKQEREEA